MMIEPSQGDVWLFDPDPIKGNEIGKKIRPGLILSHNLMNKGNSGLIFIVPLTSVSKSIPSHILIAPPNGGLAVPSYALSEQMRSISKVRLIKKLGCVHSKILLREIRKWVLYLTSIED